MKKSRIQAAPGLCVCFGAVALALIVWLNAKDTGKWRGRAGELRAAAQYRYSVDGSKMQLLAQAEQVWGSHRSAPRVPTLALVFSDASPVSKANLPNWERLLSELRSSRKDEVWFLTFDTWRLVQPLVQSCDSRGFTCRVFTIKDPAAFAIRTGIRSVPVTIVVREQARVGVFAGGELAGAALWTVVGSINVPVNSSDETLFLAGPVDPLLVSPPVQE